MTEPLWLAADCFEAQITQLEEELVNLSPGDFARLKDGVAENIPDVRRQARERIERVVGRSQAREQARARELAPLQRPSLAHGEIVADAINTDPEDPE